jgi:hypothetical protein
VLRATVGEGGAVANVGGNVSTLQRNRHRMGVNPAVLARREEVCRLRYREHLSMRQIAVRVGVDHKQVRHDLAALRKAAGRSLARQQRECHADVSQTLNAIEAAAWVAFEESRRPRVKTTYQFVRTDGRKPIKRSVTVVADVGDEPAEPKPPLPGMELMAKVVVREPRAGDNKFLAILCDVTRQRREFFGTDEKAGDGGEPKPRIQFIKVSGPTQINITADGPDGSPYRAPPPLTIDAPPDPPAIEGPATEPEAPDAGPG